MFLPGFCLSTSTYLLGFLHTGDNEIVEVLEGFDTRKILSGYVEAEVLFYQYHHIDQSRLSSSRVSINGASGWMTSMSTSNSSARVVLIFSMISSFVIYLFSLVNYGLILRMISVELVPPNPNELERNVSNSRFTRWVGIFNCAEASSGSSKLDWER